MTTNMSTNTNQLYQELDYLCLIISSFFMQDFIGGNRELCLPNPSLLWLYFTSRPLRNCMYMGMAARVAFNALFRVGERGFNLRNSCFISLFAYTAWKNISWTMGRALDSLNSSNASSSNWIGNWFTSASHLGGSWFLGGGNGEWYAFLGHNSPEEVQVLPQMILDQMKMRKKGSQEEEEYEGHEPAHQATPRFEEVFENKGEEENSPRGY